MFYKGIRDPYLFLEYLLTIDTDGNQVIRPSTSDNRHNNIAQITFDYISRLPEFYYFRAIN